MLMCRADALDVGTNWPNNRDQDESSPCLRHHCQYQTAHHVFQSSLLSQKQIILQYFRQEVISFLISIGYFT